MLSSRFTEGTKPWKFIDFPSDFQILTSAVDCRARASKLYQSDALFPDGMDALLDNADALERRPDAVALLKPNNPPEKHHRFLR